MRTWVVLLPGALERDGDEFLFPRNSPVLEKLFLRGQIIRIAAAESSFPEQEWLGLKTDSPRLSEGVLSVSAFGADPPDRSVHFCLSLMTANGEKAASPEFPPDAELLDQIWASALLLETSRLKLVKGVGLDHGLVWEDGSTELGCTPRDELEATALRESLPVGDGEKLLRRFIDDSINLLSDLEANRIRQEEGLEVLNLLWPWGPGFRPRMPNLTTERGMSVRVESTSTKLKGLCRLVGYRHGDPWALGEGTNLKLEDMACSLRELPMSLAVIPTIGEFRQKEKHEEACWLGREVLTRLVDPLLKEESGEPIRLLLVANPFEGDGLALDFRSTALREKREIPFSLEALQEKSLPRQELPSLIAEALTAR